MIAPNRMSMFMPQGFGAGSGMWKFEVLHFQLSRSGTIRTPAPRGHFTGPILVSFGLATATRR
jgi:hypothetical protein